MSLSDAVLSNVLSPASLTFVLGLGAGLLRSDLSVPEGVGKGVAVYLMFAIGLKGGVAVSDSMIDLTLILSLTGGVLMSFLMPAVAFVFLRITAGLNRIEAAAVAAHYGSISVVTFVTATGFLGRQSVDYEGYLVAVVALMETPAIITGIWLALGGSRRQSDRGWASPELMREVFLNGSVVLLTGGFLIGLTVGPGGYVSVKPFFSDLFSGVLCLFLLDMGLLAASRLRGAGLLRGPVLAFGVYMPLLGAILGLMVGSLAGLSVGGAMLMAVLGASASYIAVPAAMRMALPQANPALYLSLSLAITFPFNIVVGIPLYYSVAQWMYGG